MTAFTEFISSEPTKKPQIASAWNYLRLSPLPSMFRRSSGPWCMFNYRCKDTCGDAFSPCTRRNGKTRSIGKCVCDNVGDEMRTRKRHLLLWRYPRKRLTVDKTLANILTVYSWVTNLREIQINLKKQRLQTRLWNWC